MCTKGWMNDGTKWKKNITKEIWWLVETGSVEHDGVAKMENYPILTVVCVSSIM